MNRKTQQILLHIIGCVVFLSLPLLFSPESLSLRAYLTNPPTQRDIIAYLLVLGVFYANFYLFIPRLYFRRKYAGYIILNVLCFILIIAIPATILQHPYQPAFNAGPPPPYPNDPRSRQPYPGQPNFGPPSRPEGPRHEQPDPAHPAPGPPHTHFFLDFNQHLFVFFLVLSLALLLKIRDRWKKAEAEKLHAELAYLKAQVNPHFLFNTLNSIYALALEKSDRTPDAIVKLSAMMRYVLLDTGRDKVPLEKEITYLSNYIDLQQTRFEGSSQVDFTISGQAEGKSIAPLLLIPFVENAFKHGINPENPSTIIIRLNIRDEQLFLHVINKKVAFPKPLPSPSGLGIQNTRQRLRHLYPGRFTLDIIDGAKDFAVSLTLNLT